MGPIIPAHQPRQNYAKMIGDQLSESMKNYFQSQASSKAMQQENEALKKAGIDISGISDPKMRQLYVGAALQGANAQQLQTIKDQARDERLKKTQDLIGSFYQNPKDSRSDSLILKGEEPKKMNNSGQENLTERRVFPDELIAQVSIEDPQTARIMQQQNDIAIREDREEKKSKVKEFESERGYHSSYAKDQEKAAEQLRETIPKKTMALDFARNAVETGDVGYFSLDKLADVTGIDLFRTAKGTQLLTAGKENLLSNMGRVSARAQNIWFEQRLNSMFPKIGQSKEANLTAQEMLEGEVELDRAYLDAFDKTVEDDEKKYGFTRKDASKRARNQIKPLEKEILNRTSYRMKEIEEQEKGLPKLKSEVGKNVSKGTPMTLAMAKLYKDKFGADALKVAEKNGYHIPSIEEYKIYRMRPQEVRELQ